MDTDLIAYNNALTEGDKAICDILSETINNNLNSTESKIWHAHPVWFIEGNPVVGYSKLKNCIRLMFWSGQSFDEELLNVRGKKFKDASIEFTHADQINQEDIKRWLEKSEKIQWDYKNIVKRKGVLERLK
ncbi:DUF1801 domain-containing protein [Flavobacterium sp. MK4S-17]|uniref:DUF1801 domain-containing protein n=1 Tax=Flavobacterium sp. MK4S-17 TaxID=2543737 RepID=UPI0013580A9A|nr:DUF1801 domain-containing protein [Flavobacterium sp. MK4S-17]